MVTFPMAGAQPAHVGDSLSGIFHCWKAPRCFFVVLSALLLSTIAGRDWASLLNSGSSRFPSSGHASVENTPELGNKGENRSEMYNPSNSPGWLANIHCWNPTLRANTVNLGDRHSHQG